MSVMHGHFPSAQIGSLITVRFTCLCPLPLIPNEIRSVSLFTDMAGPTFFGNGSDYFKILSMDDNTVLIGAKNNVFNLSLTRLIENRDNRIEWTSSEAHREMCVLKGKNNSDCQNYIRIYARTSDRQIMLCGTNSFKPMCRYYKLNPVSSNGLTHEMLQEFEGEGQYTCLAK